MLTSLPTVEVAQPLRAETVPPKILPRVLKRFDMVTIYFSIIFGSYGAAQLAAQGWAGILMLLLAAVTFLVPCALGAYELGTLFPSEGGIYVWARKTLGPVHGFIAGWLSWIPIFLLLPLDASVIVAHIQYALGQEWSLAGQVVAQIGYIWLLMIVCALRLRISQSVVNVMFFVALGIAVTVLIVGFMHGAPVTPIDQEIFSFDLGKYGFLYSAAVLWLLGVEVPFNMGAEFSDHKKTGGTMFTWGTLALVLGYGMGVVGILFSSSVGTIDQTTGISRAVATISPVAGTIIAIMTSLAAFAQATTAMNAYSRLLFIGGVEERLPRLMMRVSKLGKTPWPAMFVQAIGGTIVILIFATQTDLIVTFNLYLAALVAVWCASLFYIYIGLILARKRYKALYTERGAAVWKIPGGKIGLWSCVIGGVFFNALAIYFVFAKPWVDGITPHDWRVWLGVTSVVIPLIGTLVYLFGKRYEQRKAA